VAIAKRADLWGYVQKALLQESRPPAPPEYYPRTVRLIAPPSVALREAIDWHDPSTRSKAEAHLAAVENAVAAGRARRAARHRSAFLGLLHTDRVAHARASAARSGLRLDPMGRGPVFDRPITYYRDRLPWGILPISSYGDDRLPPRASSVVDRWNEAGDVFDRYYMADEPRTTCFPTQSLIGVVDNDARVGDWFVLDRWAS
jgi:hypothetical protein